MHLLNRSRIDARGSGHSGTPGPWLPRCPARRSRGGRASVTGPAAIVWDNGDAPHQPVESADAGEIDATAAALLSGKIIVLREYVGRALGDERHDRTEVLGHVAAELARVSVILTAATEGVDDEDDAEPYCLTCGQWVHMFHGYEGWRHFRGEGIAASPVELYDAGHEAVLASSPIELPRGAAARIRNSRNSSSSRSRSWQLVADRGRQRRPRNGRRTSRASG